MFKKASNVTSVPVEIPMLHGNKVWTFSEDRLVGSAVCLERRVFQQKLLSAGFVTDCDWTTKQESLWVSHLLGIETAE